LDSRRTGRLNSAALVHLETTHLNADILSTNTSAAYTPVSISIWFAREKRLFVGDLLYPYTAISLSALGSAPKDYTATLRKVIAFVEEEGPKPLPTQGGGGAATTGAAAEDMGAAPPHEVASSTASASASAEGGAGGSAVDATAGAAADEGAAVDEGAAMDEGAASEPVANVAGGWRERLEAAAAPVREAYKSKTRNRKSTNKEALAERNEGLVAAFVGLGIPAEVAAAAVKRGSGAIDYLLEKGNLDAILIGGGSAGAIEVVDMTQARDPNAVPDPPAVTPPPPPAAVGEQAQMFAMMLGMEPLDLMARVDVETLLELCGGSIEVALDMFLTNEAQCRDLAPPKAAAPAEGGTEGAAVAVEEGGKLPVPNTGPPTEVTLACGHVEAALPTSSLQQVLALCTGISTGATTPSGFVEDGVCEYSDGMYTIVAPMDVDWS